MHRIVFITFVLALVGCARNEVILPLANSDPRVATTERIHVATLREPAEAQNVLYSGNRSSALSFAEIDVSIPRERAPGSIVYPRQKPNLAEQFAAVRTITNRNDAQFVAAINAQLAAQPPDRRQIFLFVHGYNTNFASGIFRQAQIHHDFEVAGVAVNFSWASAGKTPLYLYDRDSAQFARSGLYRTLKLLARTNASGIVLLGHSMGGFVTMETLRDIGLRGEAGLLRKIDTLILASPDIDIDVFREQLAEIEPMPEQFVIFVSRYDRALQASQTLRGGSQRLGEGGHIEELREAGITVIDLSTVDDGNDRTNHTTFATSETVMKIARSGALSRNAIVGKNPETPLRPIGEGIGAVSDVASAIIYLPAKIVGVR